MRLWQVFIKSVREQKRDLWVIGLSLAFAPLFVFIYWLMTGGTGSTAYGVLVINQDVPAAGLSAGTEIVQSLRELAYQNGAPLLRVTETGERAEAETRLRNREAAALVIIPPDFSEKLAAFRAGDTSAATRLTFIGDLLVLAVLVRSVDRSAR